MGFQTGRKALIEEYGFEKPLIDSAQAEAWKLAHEEWNNRGLGGFRRWCANEGESYRNYLEEISRNGYVD